jgi:hypothetical protein
VNAQECLSPKKIWVLVAIGVIISVAAIACTHEVRYIVSGSMDGDDQPYDIKTIPIYSLVMIKDVDGKDMLDEFEVGDVIAFHYSGVVVVHRVIAIDPVAGTITAHGDARSEGDVQEVTSDMVVGKVTGVAPLLGQVVHFVKSSPIILIAMIAVLIVAAYAVSDIVRIYRKG